MTDEQMDARLRNAGEAWRATTAPTEDISSIEPHSLTTPEVPRPRRHRTGLLASAAVVAAALVAGGSVLVANIADNGQSTSGVDSAALEGTVWGLVGWDDDPPRQQPLDTVYIGDNGEFVANDDCVLLTAHAAVDGDTISFSESNTRYLGCTDSYGPSIIAGFRTPLTEAHYTLDGDGLTLRGVGEHVLHFVPAPELPVPVADYPTFTETSWRLVSLAPEENSSRPASDPLMFRIDGNQLTADAGCKTINGTVTTDGSHVTVDQGTVTGNACGGDGFLVQSVLSGAFTQTVRGTELTIEGMAGSLTYQWVPGNRDATDPDKLTERLWRLTSVAGVPVDDKVVFNVHSDGTVSGYDGCREFDSPEAQVGAGTLTVTGLRSVEPSSADCNGDLASTVDDFLSDGRAIWHIADGELVINSSGDAQGFALVFQRDDPNAPPVYPPPPSLIGSAWTLITINDADGNDVQVAGSGSLSIGTDGSLKGNDGCNAMSGDVQLADQTIDFGGGLAITEMACPDDVMTTAQHVDAVLQGSVEWNIDGDRLTLTKDGVGTLVYQAGDSNPPTLAAIVGPTWQLTTIEDGTGPNGTASSVVTEVTVVFDKDGQATISHRCYVDKAAVQIGSDTLDISQNHAVSSIPCAATPTQQQEQDENQVVDDVLSGQVTWKIDAAGLRISKDGVGALVFVP